MLVSLFFEYSLLSYQGHRPNRLRRNDGRPRDQIKQCHNRNANLSENVFLDRLVSEFDECIVFTRQNQLFKRKRARESLINPKKVICSAVVDLKRERERERETVT